MKEQWRYIVGHKDRYEVSSYGRVRGWYHNHGRRQTYRLLKLKHKSNGYRQVCLAKDDGVRRYAYVHRLVLEAFVSRCPTGLEAAHLDGTRDNNKLNNLKWTTRAENHSHKRLHGTERLGEARWGTKLTARRARQIHKALKSGASVTALAKLHGVSKGAIHGIQEGRTWCEAIGVERT